MSIDMEKARTMDAGGLALALMAHHLKNPDAPMLKWTNYTCRGVVTRKQLWAMEGYVPDFHMEERA